MKNKTLIIALFTILLGFSFTLNVHAEIPEPQITATNTLSTQIRLNYKLSSCGEYKTCGVVLINLNWYYKNDYAIILRSAGDSYKTYDGLNKGETYMFKAAVYWFDDDGKYHMSLPGKPITIKAQAPTGRVVTGISITKEPTKTTYKAGEKFDPTGMKVKVNYNTGDSPEIEDGKGCEFTPTTIASNTTSVTVTCEGHTASQKIAVNGSIGTDSKITTLKKKSDPSKTTYKVGEKFDPTGLVLEADYEDGTTGDINVKDAVSNNICKITPDGALTKNDTEVTITCGNAPYKQKITVSGTTEPTKEIQEVTNVSGNPTKTTYSEGETFNPNGMKMDVTYKDGTKGTIDVSADQCTFTPSTLKLDTKEVIVKCGNATTTVTVTVTSSGGSSGGSSTCTPTKPSIHKPVTATDTWTNMLAGEDGDNCSKDDTTYEWSKSASFPAGSTVTGKTYSETTASGRTIYLRACYAGRCSKSTSTETGIETTAPTCTITLKKKVDDTTTDYLCNRWTRGDVFAEVKCEDVGPSGLEKVAWIEGDVTAPTYINQAFNLGGASSYTVGSTTYSNTIGKLNITGTYESRGYAIDRAGNQFYTNKCTVKVDKKAPTGGKANADKSTKEKLVITLETELKDEHSGIAEYRVEYKKKSASTWQTMKEFVNTDKSGTTSYQATSASASCVAGDYYNWRVVKKDIATNSDITDTFTKKCPES